MSEFDDSFTVSEGNFVMSHLENRTATRFKFCIRHAFMAIMTSEKFHFNLLMVTLIFGIWAFDPPGPAND